MRKLIKGDIVTPRYSLDFGPKLGEYGKVITPQERYWTWSVEVEFERNGEKHYYNISPRMLIGRSPLELLASCAT